jgi:KDO2-lipid IV(A) lauroyltransferase
MLKKFIDDIPRAHIVNMGKLAGALLYFLDVPHRRLTRSHLHLCYPQWSPDHIRQLSKRIFKNVGITLLEVFRMAFISRKTLLSMFRIEGEEHLLNALRNNRGVIVISAHMGNWLNGFQFGGCYFQKSFTGIVRRFRYKFLDRWFHFLLTRFGNEIIYKKWAMTQMQQTLRKRGVVVVTIDQGRRKQGVDVDFFGHKATITPAIALLALRCKSPVIPIYCLRESDGRHTIHMLPALKMERTKDLRADLQKNTQKMMNAVEDMIRQYPDQWIWFQRIWKRTHPDLYSGWGLGKKRRSKKISPVEATSTARFP